MRRRAHLKALVMTALGLRLSKAQVKTGRLGQFNSLSRWRWIRER